MRRSRIVWRDYANESDSNTQRFLESLLPKLNVRFWIDKSEITQKFNEMFALWVPCQ